MTKTFLLAVALLFCAAAPRAHADAQDEAQSALDGNADRVIDGSAQVESSPVVFARKGGSRGPDLTIPTDAAESVGAEPPSAETKEKKPAKDWTNVKVGVVGALAGLAIGFAFGPLGMLIGAAVGFLAGWAGSWAARKYLIKE